MTICVQWAGVTTGKMSTNVLSITWEPQPALTLTVQLVALISNMFRTRMDPCMQFLISIECSHIGAWGIMTWPRVRRVRIWRSEPCSSRHTPGSIFSHLKVLLTNFTKFKYEKARNEWHHLLASSTCSIWSNYLLIMDNEQTVLALRFLHSTRHSSFNISPELEEFSAAWH